MLIMGRYGVHSQEILDRNDKLIGFNAGFGSHTEHESGYHGFEQKAPEGLKYKLKLKKIKKHPFYNDIIKNPDEIQMLELADGNVWITNDLGDYYKILKKPKEEQQKIINNYINNYDRQREEEFYMKMKITPSNPSVIPLWDDTNFDLISTNNYGKKILMSLYEEIKKGNVAISSDYSFMFKDRGLSFVIVDRLNEDDLKNKRLRDHQNFLAKNFKKQYNEYLKKEGLAGYGVEMKYPLGFANLRTVGLYETKEGFSPNFYVEIYHVDNGKWNNDSCLFNVKRYMTDLEIKHLVTIAKSKEFMSFANNRSKKDIEEYIINQLEKFNEQQKDKTEPDQRIGKPGRHH